jgi:hypothetical protein
MSRTKGINWEAPSKKQTGRNRNRWSVGHGHEAVRSDKERERERVRRKKMGGQEVVESNTVGGANTGKGLLSSFQKALGRDGMILK